MAAQQPDFNQVSQALQTLTNQMGLVQNMPAIQGQQQVTQQLQQLTQQLEQSTQQLTQQQQQATRQLTAQLTALTAQVTGQGATLTTLTTQLTANNHNSMARALNSSITRTEIQLTPVKDQNNQVPQGFPATLRALNLLTVAQIDALLTAYAMPIAGNLSNKRQSFRRYIGIGVET